MKYALAAIMSLFAFSAVAETKQVTERPQTLAQHDFKGSSAQFKGRCIASEGKLKFENGEWNCIKK